MSEFRRFVTGSQGTIQDVRDANKVVGGVWEEVNLRKTRDVGRRETL